MKNLSCTHLASHDEERLSHEDYYELKDIRDSYAGAHTLKMIYTVVAGIKSKASCVKKMIEQQNWILRTRDS